MRLALTSGLLLTGLAYGQVWEKPIAPGLTYRMEFDGSVPRAIHILRYSPKSPILAIPALADDVVYTPGPLQGRELLSRMATRTGALAAINADFFPATGDPLGLMLRNGELISEPFPNRPAFAWGERGAYWCGTVDYQGKWSFGEFRGSIDGVNRVCGLNSVVLFSASAGEARAKLPSVWVQLEVASTLLPNREISAKVLAIRTDLPSAPVDPGTMWLIATGTRMAEVSRLRTNDELTFGLTLPGFDAKKFPNAVGAGSVLMKEGKIALNPLVEKFDASFTDKRHPRSAIGVDAFGDLVLIAVDGRQKMSDGATLRELAEIALRLGCVDAVNLDGGGSTTLTIGPEPVNRTSGEERAIANAILLLADQRLGAMQDTTERKVSVPSEVTAGQAFDVFLVEPDGSTVPNQEILWTTSGSLWIDQGGRCRALAVGPGTVTAWIHGTPYRATITVVAKPPNSR